MSEALSRDGILRRFEAWLDRALEAEDAPHGIEPEILQALAAEDGEEGLGSDPRCDDYALWAAVTALTQEVKLQGRAFKELTEGLAAQSSRTAEEMRAVYRERVREAQSEAERRCRREILGALIDLRDRLGRGLESVRLSRVENSHHKTPRGWLQRLLREPNDDACTATLAALTKGYELGLDRLDQTLDEFHAREIRCEGQPFDPRRMNAIDREESAAVPEGTVLEVYRSGYEWNGEVFRPAQVKVACAPAEGSPHE